MQNKSLLKRDKGKEQSLLLIGLSVIHTHTHTYSHTNTHTHTLSRQPGGNGCIKITDSQTIGPSPTHRVPHTHKSTHTHTHTRTHTYTHSPSLASRSEGSSLDV